MVSLRQLAVALCMLVVAGWHPNLAGAAPVKRALLIGVHAYNHGPGSAFYDLNTERDVRILRDTLLSPRFGFEAENIKCLTTPAETTHAAIVAAFREFLISRTRPGDIVYVHYSGHGSQVPAINDAEEPDGYDQTLVPSDYGPNGANQIRDDDIRTLLAELMAKHPGSVLLTFDCCHSGSNTRGDELVRGKPWSGPPVARPAMAPSDAPVTRGASVPAAGFFHAGEAKAGGYATLSACRDDQSAVEMRDEQGKPVGRFTYSLVRALSDAGPDTTLRDLFEDVNERLSARFPDQNPQCEGSLDQRLFDGRILAPQPYTLVRKDGEALRLQAGEVQGVTEGSEYALFPEGTKEFRGVKPLATAKVTSVFTTDSVLSLDGPTPDGTSWVGCRAVETAHRFPEGSITVDAGPIAATGWGKSLLHELRSVDLVNLEPKPGQAPLLRLQPAGAAKPSGAVRDAASRTRPDAGGTGAPRVELVRADDGAVIRDVAADRGAPDALREALVREARWQTIKQLSNTPPDMRLQIRLVPVEVRRADPNAPLRATWARDLPVDSIRGPGGQVTLPVGSYVGFDVKYDGPERVYLTVLDLQRNGSISAAWPAAGRTISNNVILPREEWRPLMNGRQRAMVYIDEPLGPEVLKAIATVEQVDYRPLYQPAASRGAPDDSRPEEKRAYESPIGKLIRSAASGERGEAVNAETGDWTTASVTFQVVAPSRPGPAEQPKTASRTEENR